MNNSAILPGYISLSQAEEIYGVKPDTLKKRCQLNKIIGAKKVGKTWFVPRIPNVDPNKTYKENYPHLNFDSSYITNMSLYDAESESRSILFQQNKSATLVWEYGYYFLSLIFKHSNLHRSYLPIAALLTETHSAIRSSFILNLYGYHSDAIAILRKAHESIVKAIAGKTKPIKLWKIGFSADRQAAESIIGVNFNHIYKIESSFTHSNQFKLFEAAMDMKDANKQVGVCYGPQLDIKYFRIAINTSIFWLYISIQSVPYLFTGQVSQYWLDNKEESAKFLRDYLVGSNAFVKDLNAFDICLRKLSNSI